MYVLLLAFKVSFPYTSKVAENTDVVTHLKFQNFIYTPNRSISNSLPFFQIQKVYS